MAIDRSARVDVDALVTDESWQKLIRKMLVATAELGTTVTTSETGYVAGTGADNIEVNVCLTAPTSSNRSIRVTVDAAVTDEAWQKFLRKVMVATQECGVTSTATKVYSLRASEKDSLTVAVT